MSEIIHPDIIQFWNAAGYTVNILPRISRLSLIKHLCYRDFFDLYKDGDWFAHYAQSEMYSVRPPHNIEYKYNNQFYSEEQMLRIIRLKAFY